MAQSSSIMNVVLYLSLLVLFRKVVVLTLHMQNEIVEKKHMNILVVARALRFQGTTPIRFWEECVVAIVI